jgi:hypothetical protein
MATALSTRRRRFIFTPTANERQYLDLRKGKIGSLGDAQNGIADADIAMTAVGTLPSPRPPADGSGY